MNAFNASKNSSCLMKNIHTLATMNGKRQELHGASLLVENGKVAGINPNSKSIPSNAVELDLTDHVVMPGMVNTHHHMFQNLTRAYRLAQDHALFGWLQALYPKWMTLTPLAAHFSAKLAMAELLRHGCTTSSDHLYLYPNGVRLDDTIAAAADVGLRFVVTRGSMDIGESDGGLPPDAAVESMDAILEDTARCIETFHDGQDGAMVQVGVAPCSPFTTSRELMLKSVEMARHYKVRLHTHLAENDDDIVYSKERFGMAPGEYIEDLELMGADVWHAHCVKLTDDESAHFARTGTGIAHCPCSNMRLGSGVAPLRRWLEQKVAVGLGVDGSSSNDAGSVLSEARQAMLLQRVSLGAGALTARQALEVATLGGASVLGRKDIGHLSLGSCADLVAYNLRRVELAGASDDPLAALVLCQPGRVDYAMVDGRLLIEDGNFVRLDERGLLEQHHQLSRQMLASG